MQKEITGNVGSAPIVPDQARPSFTPHTSSIASAFNDSPPSSAPVQTKPLQSPYGSDSTPTPTPAPTAAPRVNNIWGEDDTQHRSSTRVLRGPGGGSSGVAGALGGAAPVEEVRRGGVARGNNNATSANSPFSNAQPEVKRAGTRVAQAPGGGSSGNILSWGH